MSAFMNLKSVIPNTLVNWANPQLPKGQAQNPQIQVDPCEACGKRPKFVENGFTHPYCGRTCAIAIKAQAGRNVKSYGNPVQNQAVCASPNCHRLGRPQHAGFCCNAHAEDAMRKKQGASCAQCGLVPRSSGELCAGCHRGAQAQTSTTLVEIDTKGPTFRSVVSTVVDNWDPLSNPADPPTVHKAYEVVSPRRTLNRFHVYRKSLERFGQVQEISTFHSSQCVCDLGTQPQTQLCDAPSCGICSIIKSGFTKLAFSVPYNTGRHGKGIYSYTDSSMADTHATSCTTSPYRVMILCNVVIRKGGSPHISSSNRSIQDGETLVVADADAIIPAYVILYSKE